MNIDWDEIVHRAEETPRAIWAAHEPLVDEIETIVIMSVRREGNERVYRTRWAGDWLQAVALTRLSMRNLDAEVQEI